MRITTTADSTISENQVHPRSSRSVSIPSIIRRAIFYSALTLCSAAPALAQSSWSTVDDVANGWEWGMAADRFGNVFVAGDIEEDGAIKACITRTNDQGATWTSTIHPEVDSYGGIAATTIEIAPATPDLPAVVQDQIVASGSANGQWITRRSVDAGATWQTVDVFVHSTANSALKPDVTGVAIDSAGNIYVIGFATRTSVVKNKTSSAYYWLVRRIANNAPAATSEVGKTTFDLFETANGGYSWPQGIVCVGTNAFVAGTSGDRWQVRKKSNDSAVWAMVDDFRYDSNYSSGANAIATDLAGNLYVVGAGTRAVDKSGRATRAYWIVRKGTGVGAGSFQTIDRFELELNKSSAAYGVAVDAGGNVHVTGHGFSTVGAYQPGHWISRRLAAGTGVWSTTDHFYLSQDSISQGREIIADAFGNVFAAGMARGQTGDHEWIVRRNDTP